MSATNYGDVKKSVIITGNGNSVTFVVDDSTEKAAQARAAYLVYMFNSLRKLQLGGIDRQAASEDNPQLSLDGIYTALMTGRPESHMEKIEGEKKEAKLLSVLEELDAQTELALLGEPGSGKSTFVNFLVLCLTGEAIGHPHANLQALTEPLPTTEDAEEKEKERRQKWMHGALLPVRVILRDFAKGGLPEEGPATADHLWQHIRSTLEDNRQGSFAEHLHEELQQSGGLIMLDGLDEVSDPERVRPQIIQAVNAFKNAYSNCRFLVTSRTYAYQKQAWKLPGFKEAIIQPFNLPQITQFVDRWYTHIGELRQWSVQDSQGKAAVLKSAISANSNLQHLADRPLLLTLMASLHAWRGGTLPDKREELYQDSVDLLLDWWERPKIEHLASGQIREVQPGIAQWLQADRDKVRDLLNELAYKAHADQQDLDGCADIPEGDLVLGLMDINNNKDANTKMLVEYLSFRAGLLVPRGQRVYSLPHRTFQEYLAACHLTADDDYPLSLADLARAEPNRWREAVMLAAAKAWRGARSSIWGLVDALCYAPPKDSDNAEADIWGAHLAAQALVEVADLSQVSARQQPKVERLREWLLRLMREDWLPPIERALAGRNLAKLGDPRPEVMTLEGMQFCYVPGGPFIYQGEENDSLSEGFWLGRYPVSNVQYQEFVKAGGYANPAYWSEAAKAGLWENGRFKGKYEDHATSAPRIFGEPFDLANHPQVGFSWYEAVAYCRWLTDYGREQGWIDKKSCFVLPSEFQWEKAARGGDQIGVEPIFIKLEELKDKRGAAAKQELIANPNYRREYPWGDELTLNLVNCSDSGIDSTSALGCFTSGVGPLGIEEMAGNVFEWSLSKWGGDVEIDASGNARVIRGGSWGAIDDLNRCSARLSFNPFDRYDLIGFRIGLFPSSKNG
ncbi:MAG: SUMF1/EgtB/PvdO family nonheme iron enzyme [Calditrichia bacterium]